MTSSARWPFGMADRACVSIVSTDKDFAQLVNANVELIDMGKGTVMGPAGVEEKWAFHPKILGLLTLMGDKSDNVPGVEGMVKTAAKLLQTYDTVFEVTRRRSTRSRASEVSASWHCSLDRVGTQADHHSRHGTSIRSRRNRPSRPGLGTPRRALSSLQLSATAHDGRAARSALRRPGRPVRLPHHHRRRRPRYSRDCAAGGWPVRVDAETTSLDPHVAELVGMSFCWGPTDTVYVPIAHESGGTARAPSTCCCRSSRADDSKDRTEPQV